jgi:hypothetical protein
MGAFVPPDGQSSNNNNSMVGSTTTSSSNNNNVGPPSVVNNNNDGMVNHQQNKQLQQHDSTLTADGSTAGSSSTTTTQQQQAVAVEQRPPPPPPPPPQKPKQQYEENDDDIAESMLIQFPSYGTRSQATSAQWQEKTADWLLGGHSVPTPQQQLKQQQLEQQQKVLSAQEEGNNPHSNNYNQQQSGRNDNETLYVFKDWAEDEQKLWKSKRFDRGLEEPSSNDGDENDNNKLNRLKEYDVNYVKPLLEDPSRDILAAYYYHTGVFPKLKVTGPKFFLERETTTTSTEGDNKQQRFQTSSFIKCSDLGNGSRKATSVSNESNKNSNIVVPRIPEDHDDEEEDDSIVDRSTNTATSITTNTKLADNDVATGKHLSTSPAVIEEVAWMPDRLCKTCYTCDTPFSFLRRRHHCRICGQVFCNTCSGYFVPATPLQQKKESSSSLSLTSQGSQTAQQSPFSQQNSRRQLILAPSMQYGNSTILRTCKMCFDQVMAQQKQLESEEAAAADAAGRKRRKKDDGPLLPQLESGNATGGTSGGTPQPKTPQRTIAGSSPSLQDQLSAGEEQLGSVLQNLSKRRAETPYSIQRLLTQEAKLEEEEKEQSAILFHSQEGSSSNKTLDALSPMSPKRQANQSSSSLANDANEEDRKNTVDEGNRRLGVTAASQMEQMAASLMKTDAPLLWNALRDAPLVEGDEDDTKLLTNLQTKWVNKIMSLATRCCATVDPNIKRGDLLDIRPYAKIKGKKHCIEKLQFLQPNMKSNFFCLCLRPFDRQSFRADHILTALMSVGLYSEKQEQVSKCREK